MAGMLDHALLYADAGFPVLPLHSPVDGQCDCRRDCSSPAKHPRTANGLKDATTDPDAIRAWWALWPTANVGMVIPAGYVVVDVDTDKASAATNGHEMPTTAMSKTGRGWHFLYRTSEPVRPAVGILEHVDLRGLGSYIVAPRLGRRLLLGEHPEGRYRRRASVDIRGVTANGCTSRSG